MWDLIFLLIFLLGIGWGISLVVMILMRRRENFKRSLEFVFLVVKIPKKDSKEDLDRDTMASELKKLIGNSEQMIASLSGIGDSSFKSKFFGQDYISLEYIATKGVIHFVVGCPRGSKELIEKQLTGFFPDAVIREETDMGIFEKDFYQSTAVLKGGKEYAVPFQTYEHFEASDPINNILNALSQSNDQEGTAAGIQMILSPASDDWQQEVRDKSKDLSKGESKSGFSWKTPFQWLVSFGE